MPTEVDRKETRKDSFLNREQAEYKRAVDRNGTISLITF